MADTRMGTRLLENNVESRLLALPLLRTCRRNGLLATRPRMDSELQGDISPFICEGKLKLRRAGRFSPPKPVSWQ